MREVKWLVCVLAVCVALTGVARADDPTAAAMRASVEAAGPAVVPLKVVISFRQQEAENELLGTVIDETGLIVTSNTNADPASAGIILFPGTAIESEIKSMRLIRPDGTEIALKIVLRDHDLDLMFLRPEEEVELAYVDLPETGAEPALGDQLILVSRLEAIGDRQPFASATRVEAVIDKPRRLYVTHFRDRSFPFGCPVFDAAGVPVGIGTVRLMMQNGRPTMMPVVLPLADVLDDVMQVREDEAAAPAEPAEPEEPADATTAPAEGIPAEELVPAEEPMEEGSGGEGSGSY